MGPTFVGIDVVGEGEDQLGIAVVPLEGDFSVNAVLHPLHEDRLVVDDRLVLVQVLDERNNAAVVLELVALAVALIVDGDEDPAVQERQLAQALGKHVEAVFDRLEDPDVGPEGDLGAAALRGPGDHQVGRWGAALIALLIDLTVPPDLEIEPLGQGVYDGDADTVKAATIS